MLPFFLFQVVVDVAEDDVGAGGEALFGGEGYVGRHQAAVGGEQQVVDGQGRFLLENVEGCGSADQRQLDCNTGVCEAGVFCQYKVAEKKYAKIKRDM